MFHTDRHSIARRFEADATALKAGLHASTSNKGAADLEQLQWIRRCDAAELWREEGARSTVDWLAAELGVSRWRASRMVNAAHALERLPRISAYLANGSLSLDKVLELTRFATPATEKKLLSWARRTSPAGIRKRADRAADVKIKDVKSAIQARSLSWWKDSEGLSLHFKGNLPVDAGAVFTKAIDRLAETLPDLPPEEGQAERDADITFEQRRADALVAMASAQIANDQDPDIATVVVTAPIEVLACTPPTASPRLTPSIESAPTPESQFMNASLIAASIESLAAVSEKAGIDLGAALHPDTARRLSCDCRLEVSGLDGLGNTVGIDRATRIIPRWLRRQLLRRDDHHCQFPGCEATKFLHGHHIWHWALGGPTNLDNLILLCIAHHTLVHELRWSVSRGPTGEVTWFRPNGRIFDPGPAPPPPEALDRAPRRETNPRLIEARGHSRLFALAGRLIGPPDRCTPLAVGHLWSGRPPIIIRRDAADPQRG